MKNYINKRCYCVSAGVSNLICTFLIVSGAIFSSPERVLEAAEAVELPYPVTSFGSVLIGDHLYIYGGHRGRPHKYHADSTSGEFQRISLTSQKASWDPLPGDTPAQGTRMVGWKNRILRVGGMQPRNSRDEDWNLVSLDEYKCWDKETSSWKSLKPMPKGRSSHEAVVAGDTLYVAGGWFLNGDSEDAEWFSEMFSIDLSSDDAQWESHPQPFVKRAIASGLLGDSIVFIGGMDEYDNVSDTVDIYNTQSRSWVKGPQVPETPNNRMKSFGAAAASHNGSLYLSDHSGNIYKLSSPQSEWEKVGALENPRFFHRIEFDSLGELIVVGGASRQLGQFNSIEFVSLAN